MFEEFANSGQVYIYSKYVIVPVFIAFKEFYTLVYYTLFRLLIRLIALMLKVL